jgi:hypothetical protein
VPPGDAGGTVAVNRRKRTPGGAIFRRMAVSKRLPACAAALSKRPPACAAALALRLPACAAALALLLPAGALAGPMAAPALAASAVAPAQSPPLAPRSLRVSRELWATIDICNASDQPNTVGVRGSMPGNGQAHDRMYMRFRLQYVDATLKRWVDLANATTDFIAVGSAKSARQGGSSFKLVPVAGQPAFTLRGVVSFQWRQGASIVASLSRFTTAGRKSLAGADPANFSAATCPIG